MSELAFKRWFVEAWNGWLVRIEPGRGGDVGVSDLMVPVDGRLIPVELKVFVGGGAVSEIRPSQKVWHRQADRAGVVTLLAVGEKERGGCWRARVGVGLEGGGLWCDKASLRETVDFLVRTRWQG